MHLLPCNRPTEQLEPAPTTALGSDSAQERWEGYWGLADDTYYARCVRPDGVEQWYRVVDEGRVSREIADRVLVLRRPGMRRPGVSRVAVFRGSRTMLVGTSRRRTATARGAAGVRTR